MNNYLQVLVTPWDHSLCNPQVTRHKHTPLIYKVYEKLRKADEKVSVSSMAPNPATSAWGKQPGGSCLLHQ